MDHMVGMPCARRLPLPCLAIQCWSALCAAAHKDILSPLTRVGSTWWADVREQDFPAEFALEGKQYDLRWRLLQPPLLGGKWNDEGLEVQLDHGTYVVEGGAGPVTERLADLQQLLRSWDDVYPRDHRYRRKCTLLLASSLDPLS